MAARERVREFVVLRGRERTPFCGGQRDEARPRNWPVPVMLVSPWEWDSYGYEFMERAAAFGFEATNPGLHRTLRHIEKESRYESRWETSKDGPAHRMYSITDAGEAPQKAFLATGLTLPGLRPTVLPTRLCCKRRGLEKLPD